MELQAESDLIRKPSGTIGGPYKCIHLDDNIIINNIQMQIDRIQKAYEQQYANPDTESEDSAWECEEIIEDTNMGGTSSESD